MNSLYEAQPPVCMRSHGSSVIEAAVDAADLGRRFREAGAHGGSDIDAAVDAADLARRFCEARVDGADVRAGRDLLELREAGRAQVQGELEQGVLLRTELAPPVFVLVVLHLRTQAVDLRLHALEFLPEIGGLEAQVAHTVDHFLPELFDPAPQGADGVLAGREGTDGHRANLRGFARARTGNFEEKKRGNRKKKMRGLNLFIQ